MDPYRIKDWVSLHHSLGHVDKGERRQGFQLEQTLSYKGIHLRIHWLLKQSEPPNLAIWHGEGRGGANATIKYELTRQPNGLTRFDYSADFIAPLGLLGAATSRLIASGLTQHEVRKSIDQLKHLLESM